MQAVCQFIKCYSSRGGTLQRNWLERRKNARGGGFLLSPALPNHLNQRPQPRRHMTPPRIIKT